MKNSELQTCVLGSVSTNCYLLKNKKNRGTSDRGSGGSCTGNLFSRIREMQGEACCNFFLTHGHYDHILAVEDVKKKIYQIPVYACEKKQGLFWILPQICPDTETAPVP